MIALVDIDGTIADCSHRLHFIREDKSVYVPDGSVQLPSGFKPNWEAFFAFCINDKPILPVIALVKSLSLQHKIVYVTGRPFSSSEHTIYWLKSYGLYDSEYGNSMYMRATGDHRPDYIVKRELYEKMIIRDIGEAGLAIEDRDQVVKMWRSLGILTLQPCEGTY